MSATAPRRAALAILRAVRAGELLDRAAARELERLPARERAWTQELAYGTVRLRGRIDYLLEPLVRRGLASLDPDVLDVLRLGAYQLLEMDSVPGYAAVSQSVELARSAGPGRAGGLVNAVLQRIARGEVREPPDPEAEPALWLSSWGSHPEWLARRWIERFGAEGARALAEADNRRPELFLRPIGVAPEEARARLEAAGLGAETLPWAPDSLRITSGTPGEALAAAPAVVQDPAAALVARYAAVPPGARVADLCAAPGGKTLALADEGAGYVVAGDLSAERLKRVPENLLRTGVEGVGLLVSDARRPAIRPLEAVLVDAPCTGTGTLRRHPDGRWRLGEGDLAALTRLQEEILDGAAERVANGGLLVYATCSLEPEENEVQVERFLGRNGSFRLEAPPAWPAGAAEFLRADGFLEVLPFQRGTDGAFAARLRRGP